MKLKLCRSQNRNGVLVVMLAILLPVMMIILGFAVDFANIQRIRNEIRSTADLAAKAAANCLAVGGSEAEARAAAQLVAAENSVAGGGLTLQNDQIVFGHSTRNADGTYSFEENVTPVNGVKVIASRTDGSADGDIPLFFGLFYGRETIGLEQTSVASYQDIDIAIVLDRSGSMKDPVTGTSSETNRHCNPPLADSRWAATDAAVELFIQALENSPVPEKLAIVTFASDNETCAGYPCTASSLDQPLTTSMALIRTAMANRMNTIWAGHTNIYAGLTEARTHLENNATPGAEQIIILLTDGQYNQGGAPFDEASNCRSLGMTVHTITFGDGANQADMITVATNGGGNHYHAPDEDTLDNVFRQIAGTFAILIE